MLLAFDWMIAPTSSDAVGLTSGGKIEGASGELGSHAEHAGTPAWLVLAIRWDGTPRVSRAVADERSIEKVLIPRSLEILR